MGRGFRYERAKERYSGVKPRIISDNGPQFIATDFQEFIRISGMTHVRTSPYYLQSNGKIERWHQSLKGECIRPGTPLSLADVRRLVDGYVEHYNNVRLNSAIGYITPKDMLAGISRKFTVSPAPHLSKQTAQNKIGSGLRRIMKAEGIIQIRSLVAVQKRPGRRLVSQRHEPSSMN
jgi:Integrase core domain